MKKSNRKGFTIVELVIVIAVIAILAAVLIPTFSNLIKKANESSDIQAVRQMNTILAAEGAVEKNNIFDVFDALHESNLDAKDYKPLVSGTYFFWDDKADCIVYTDADYNVIFPKDYDKANKGNWFSLTQTIEAKKPTDTNYADGVTVANGAELLYVLQDIEEKPTTAVITIPAEGIDMMGASFGIDDITSNVTIQGANGQKAVIKNAIGVDVSYRGQGKTADGDDGQYNTSLFPHVAAGTTLTIENVVFENINVKNTHASNVGLLVGGTNGTVIINNVEINNATVIGHRNVGALIGNVNSNGKATIGNVTMKNVSVLTVGGRSAMLVGVIGNSEGKTALTINGSISLTNCKYDIYKCEQNENGNGLKNGAITSWAYDANNKPETGTYYFDDTALVSLNVSAVEGVKGSKLEDSFFGNYITRN